LSATAFDAGILGALRIVGAGLRRIVEELWREFPAAIEHIKQQRAVAPRGIGRLQDHDVGRRLDLAVGIARRGRKVGDDGVAIIGRIERDGCLRRDPLIGADLAKARPAKAGTRSEISKLITSACSVAGSRQAAAIAPANILRMVVSSLTTRECPFACSRC
jgi:hypothetical protein